MSTTPKVLSPPGASQTPLRVPYLAAGFFFDLDQIGTSLFASHPCKLVNPNIDYFSVLDRSNSWEISILQATNTVSLPKLGLFSWEVAENRLVGDDVFSHFYGFDPARLVEGLAIEEIIARIVEGDRENAAHLTHRAILTGAFSTVQFRVKSNNHVRPILSYGRCFRDEEGLPSFFTGGIFEHGADLVNTIVNRQFCH